MLGGLFLWCAIMPFLHVNQIQLFYECSGHGAPIIFLHGNGEDHHIFDPLIAKLSEHYTCYALDSRNHGQSETTSLYHYQTMMDDLKAFIETLELTPVNIVGFSDGSIVTLLLAIQHLNLVNKIALLGPNLSPTDLTDACIRYLQKSVKQTPNPLYQMMLEEPNIQASELTKIQAPTIIFGGDNDVYKAGTFETIHNNINHSQLIILKNHDHSSYIAHTDLLHHDLYNFFK